MSNIEKIRQEIERLENMDYPCDTSEQATGFYNALDCLSAFIGSLPEDASCTYDTNKLTPTPSVNIEDVARVQFASHAHVFDRKRKAVFDWEQFKEVAGIFYGFGKKDSLPEESKVDVTDFCKPIDPSIAHCIADNWWEMLGEEEKPSEDLEEEVKNYFQGYWPGTETAEQCNTDLHFTPSAILRLARHFAEWGARHSINWGDIQLLDTFILELSREEKDGADWGDSEKFYTEVLRRFHEFNNKKIPEIVAEWGAKHLK